MHYAKSFIAYIEQCVVDTIASADIYSGWRVRMKRGETKGKFKEEENKGMLKGVRYRMKDG